jgi:hypothetical protein
MTSQLSKFSTTFYSFNSSDSLKKQIACTVVSCNRSNRAKLLTIPIAQGVVGFNSTYCSNSLIYMDYL